MPKKVNFVHHQYNQRMWLKNHSIQDILSHSFRTKAQVEHLNTRKFKAQRGMYDAKTMPSTFRK